VNNSELEYVGFWARVGASIIDGIITLVVTLPPLFIIYGDNYIKSDSFIEGPADFVISWVLPAVAVITFWVVKQATPGKIAIGAKIVDEKTGNAASLGQLIGRYLGYFVSSIPLCLGLFWVGFDRKKQGWHDKMAGTVVVRLKDRRPREVEFK